MMNRTINEIQKYSLEDAFNIINSIINNQKEKYENTINTMSQKIDELKLEIEQLKEENKKYKNKIFQLQNQFYSLSKTFYQLNEAPNTKLLTEDNQNTFNNIRNGISQSLNISDTNTFTDNNNYINNSIINTNKKKLDLNNSIKQQLFNKKLIKKINSKSFTNNKIIGPIKLANKKYIKPTFSDSLNDLNSNYLKEQNKTITSNINNERNFKNFDLGNYTYQKENTQKEKFNIIERRIKNMKNGLNIYKTGRNRFHDDNSYFRTKYDTYSINNTQHRKIFDSIKGNNNFN